MMLLIPILFMMVVPAPATAGWDGMTWCRGGTTPGKQCTSDADCFDGGLCTQRGMPRVCVGTRYCRVSDTIECRGNYDCLPENGGTWPDDPNDYCPRGWANDVEGCDPAAAESGSDGDCGECASGAWKGRGCLKPSDCLGAPCDKTSGKGKCANGASQCEIERHGHKGYGTDSPNDTLADRMVGQSTLGSNLVRRSDRTVYLSPVSVEVWNDRVWIGERRRVSIRTVDCASAAVPEGEAIGVLGQYGVDDHYAARANDDPALGAIFDESAYTLRTVYATGTPAWRPIQCQDNPDLSGCLVGDIRRVLLYPLQPAIGAPATKVWGHLDLDGRDSPDPQANLQEVSGLATQRRCSAGSALGTPCRADEDCPSASCATTIAVADGSHGKSRVLVQRQPGTGNGSPFDVVLGQPAFASSPAAGDRCNGGGAVTAASLCRPVGLAFDAAGNLWVADHGNHRVLRFPKDFETGTSADVVIGQAGRFTNNTPGTSAGELREPTGLTYDAATDSLFVVDSGNHRVLRFANPAIDQEADHVFGQDEFTTNDHGSSSDGSACDRLRSPIDAFVIEGAHASLWVADAATNRILMWDTLEPDPGTPAAAFSGQVACADSGEGRVTPNSFGKGNGGVWFYESGPVEGVCAADQSAHRVLCWSDRREAAQRDGTPDADAVLGQASGFDRAKPNRGGDVASNTLHSPGFGTWTSKGRTPGIWVADTGNNRLLRYELPLSSGAPATAVLGQRGSLTGSECAATARGLCGPNAARADEFGNLWVADSDNGRVVLYCQAAETIPAAAGGHVCTTSNTGDDTADLVLGKPDFATGTKKTHCAGGDAITAATLCRPTDVYYDSSSGQLVVTDHGAGFNRARALVYVAPFASGMAASKVVGQHDGSFVSYEGSARGYCVGGSKNGSPCEVADDWAPSGIDPFCSGGYCEWRRTGALTAIASSGAEWYFGRGGTVVTLPDPIAAAPATPAAGAGPRFQRVFGSTNEQTWSNQWIGYTACQWTREGGGIAIDGDGNLWTMQGAGQEHNGGIFVMRGATEGATRRQSGN